jgi:CubicO group peptidase (beta-lactamase class C family)
MVSTTRSTSALTTTLMFLLLLCGCGQRAVQQRILRVEEGLIPFTADGLPKMGDPRRLTERMEHYGVPGVSVAVIDNFQVAWARGYGVLEAGNDEPVTEDSLFHAGSVAKPVSAAVALALVDRGLLDLDEDVNRKLVS